MTSLESMQAPMECSELERSLEAYLDGEFDAREQAEARAHLGACDRCRQLPRGTARLPFLFHAADQFPITARSTAHGGGLAARRGHSASLTRSTVPGRSTCPCRWFQRCSSATLTE